MLTPPPDTVETLICGLGLALGFMGCLLGTVLIITGTRKSSIRRCRSPGSLWQREEGMESRWKGRLGNRGKREGDRKAGVWRSGRANVNGRGHVVFATLGNVSSEKPMRDDSWRTSGNFCVRSGILLQR